MILQKILTFPVKILTGQESGDEITLTLKSKEATNTINYVIQRAYLAQRSNERQGTANTLTRAEVKGGGRKPWRQKGTGRARAGSNRKSCRYPKTCLFFPLISIWSLNPPTFS